MIIMTELLNGIDAPSDAELISRVRGGDLDAYGELFERHVEASRRLARQLVRGPDADDLVSDAFAKVMSVLQGGGGPDVAFRAYLLTAVRRLHVDKIRAQSKLQTSDDMTQFDPGVPFHDTAIAGFESGAAAKAFASLPERWQLVLWHLEVEGQKPADIAPLLGMSANSVSALAYRAREGLRQAFLTAHLADTSESDCRWTNEHLGAYVRKGLSKRDEAKVKAHLDECRKCTAMYLELTEVNSNLSAIIAPLLLGGAAAGYLASAGGGAAAASGVVLFFDRLKDGVLANLGTVAAGTTAATVAAVAVVAVAVGGDDKPTARPPAPTVTDPVVSSTPTPTPPKPRPTKPAERPVVVPPPVANVDNPPEVEPTPPPEEPPALTANISLASATVSDDAVVLDIDGLPAEPVTVNVELTSTSGETTFAVQDSACSVRGANPLLAACATGGGGGGAAVMLLAPSRFQAVIPLAFPSTLTSDKLTVRISIPGYDDPAEGNNTATFTFTPTPTTTPPTTPPPTTPPPPVEADLVLAVTKDDETHVTATVTGLPAEPADLVFSLSAADGVTITETTAECVLEAPTAVRCDDAVEPFAPTFTIDYPAEDAPVDVALSVVATGIVETDDSDNTASVSLGVAPVPTADLAVTLDDNQLGNGSGRFRVNVTGLPTGDGETRLRIELATAATIEDIPFECAFAEGSTSVVECDPAGSTYSGVFQVDLKAQETADVTVTVSAPGFEDPDLSNNTATIQVRITGLTGLISGTTGQGAPLEPVGKLLDDVLTLL